MSNNFYRAFEERYRGDRTVIAGRLKVYASFVAPLAARLPGAVALDLGCGRGEWLELTASYGFAPFGVDLDEGMLAACRERGLHVETADALATLRARADTSVALVSAFHLVEHLPFELVQELVAEAQRVLVPGGLLVMETPNPENLVVGTNNFYLDPSHVKPVPALLLGFLADHSGFARHSVVRLHGAPVPDQGHTIGLAEVLHGVSYDYAIVAQKQADADTLAAFDSAFATPYGVSLDQIATRFDQGWMNVVAKMDARATQSDGLDAQARAHGEALARLDEGLRHASGEFDKRLAVLEAGRGDERLAVLEAARSGERLDALDHTVHTLQERLQSELALQGTMQLAAMEKRIDAALDQIDARAARRASESEERRLQREYALKQRVEEVERQMEQADARLAPLVRRLTTSQMDQRDTLAQVSEIQRHADYTTWRLSTTEEELRQQRARADQAEAHLHALHAQLVALVHSTSWRLTEPLRLITSYSRRALAAARDGRIASGIQRRLVSTAAPTVTPEIAAAPAAAVQPLPAGPAAAEHRPGSLRALQKRIKHSNVARRIALPLMRRFPVLERPLRRLSDSRLPPPVAQPAGPPPLQGADAHILLPHDFAAMPESSRHVLLDLVRAGMPPTPPQP